MTKAINKIGEGYFSDQTLIRFGNKPLKIENLLKLPAKSGMTNIYLT
jgi:hypothetical protein